MLFQTPANLLRDIKDVLNNVNTALFHTIKVNGDGWMDAAALHKIVKIAASKQNIWLICCIASAL